MGSFIDGHELSLTFQCDLSIVRGSLNALPDGVSWPRVFTSVCIMIDGDHYTNRGSLKSQPSKTPSVFDGCDFLFARLHPFYKMPSFQRAMNDEYYKVAGFHTLSIANDIMG